MPAIWSMRYDDIDFSRESPRTSRLTRRAKRAKNTAACPAELAPPTTITCWSAHSVACVAAEP